MSWCVVRSGHRVFGAIALVLAVTSCGDDPNQPVRPTRVEISATELSWTRWDENQDGTPFVRCEVRLEARNTGATRAELGELTVYFYAGVDRREPVDTFHLDASSAASAWSSASLDPGGTAISDWTLSAGIPFSVRFDFAVRGSDRRTTTASASYTCGPAIPANAAPPSIASVSVREGALEPGGALHVTYSAASDIGIWRTLVLVSGPCEFSGYVNDFGAHEVSRTLGITVPSECTLDVPLHIAVIVLDVGLQQSVRTLPTNVVLSDRSVPKVTAMLQYENTSVPTLSGAFLTGDTIVVLTTASDNHRLRWLVWEAEPGTAADSVRVSGPEALYYLSIPVRSEWAQSGTVTLRVFARDESGNTSAAVASAPGAITVYPGVSRPSAVTYLPDSRVSDVLVDERRSAIYVLTLSKLFVLSATTLEVTESLDLPLPSGGAFDFTPGGDSLVIGPHNGRSLAIFDLRPGATPRFTVVPVSLADPTIGQGSAEIVVGSNNRVYMVLAERQPDGVVRYGVIEHDLATASERHVEGATYLGGRSFDHATIVMSREGCAAPYNVAADVLGRCGDPRGYGFDF
ncbi:MAG TPA: hypothetical protein VHM30_18510, partial [Gemmatimonadaceae bacterium]|nr:hypothetical protein [Gemmatimonadaceae bacterium]